MRRTILVAAVLVTALSAAATSSALTSKTTVKVVLKEFTLKPAPASVPAGDITFVATNKGTLEHEFVVVKSNRPPGSFPIKANDKAKIPSSAELAEIEDIEPGQTKRITLKLAKGKYVLICDIAGHYKAGQRAGFKVR